MPGQARLNDVWSGICNCHTPPIPMTGVIVAVSSDVQSNGLGEARITDIVVGNCGHTGILVSGSPTVLDNGLQVSRCNDSTTGCLQGTIVTCSGDVNAGLVSSGSVYTEVDYGNLDDEESTDDGLNIYPSISGRTPTVVEIQRSESLDVAPKTTVEENKTPPEEKETPPMECNEITESPIPESYVLSPNFMVKHLSTQCAVSHYIIRAQHGLTLADIVCNLQAWAQYVGEELVEKYGNAVMITSGFRLGSSTSQHERGQAADIQFRGFTNQQYYDAAIWVRNNIAYDQLILEYGGNRPWLHISFNRSGNRPASASNKFGTRISGNNYSWGKLIHRA